jgi:hypothetical protein
MMQNEKREIGGSTQRAPRTETIGQDESWSVSELTGHAMR